MSSVHPISDRGYESLRRAVSSPEASGRRIGRYTLVRELGRGGMAVVHEAEDPELRRRVALKVLRADATEPRVIQRLHREAAIAAQLRHPNIVRIHEVGMADDGSGQPVHFIAMDLVEGRTFESLLTERGTSREKLLEILDSVADAVAFAHEQGVVHRDLKPANILLDDAGRVALADFGLARAVSFATPLTHTHAVMGTPQFMAPEQVEGRGDEIDARTDVYALGVILYEILAGRPPFAADSLASLYEKILRVDPIHPTRVDATIDRDLEWICLTAMSKERERRYRDARAFQQDLRRFREGHPVLARPPSLFYRMRKRLRRHRAPVLVSSAALAVVAIVLGILVPRLRQAEEDALLQMRRSVDRALAAALGFRRLGDVARMQEFGAEVERVCREVSERDPGLAEPHYHRGRIRRALMEEEAAAAHQEEALRIDRSFAPARYERVVLNARRYWKAVRGAVREYWAGNGGALRPPDIRALAKVDPACAAIRRTIEDDLGPLSVPGTLTGTPASFIQGLSTWIAGDSDRARAQFDQASSRDPEAEELWEVLGHLALERGDWDGALEQWNRAIEADRGHVAYLDARSEILLHLGFELMIRLRPVGDYFDRALADLARALELKPGQPELGIRRAIARSHQADLALMERRSPIPACEAGLAELEEVLRRHPGEAEAWQWKGYLLMKWGYGVAHTGGDPAGLFTEAVAACDQALHRDPRLDMAWSNRGTSKYLLARRGGEGRERAALLRSAADDLDRSLKLNRGYANRWVGAARIRMDLAGLGGRAPGIDAVSELDQAVASLRTAVELVSDRYDVWFSLAQACRQRGERAEEAGSGAPAWYEEARQALLRAESLRPGDAELAAERALLRSRVER